MSRRPDGALESDVLKVLWATDQPMTPAEVRDRLETHLAYTSVATVLTRLQAKGLVTRSEAARGFAYRAAVTEPELAARVMGTVLDSSRDRPAVMAGFVESLSSKDAETLRDLLQARDR
jgi:predicted transcriptional regulator